MVVKVIGGAVSGILTILGIKTLIEAPPTKHVEMANATKIWMDGEPEYDTPVCVFKPPKDIQHATIWIYLRSSGTYQGSPVAAAKIRTLADGRVQTEIVRLGWRAMNILYKEVTYRMERVTTTHQVFPGYLNLIG